MKSKLIDRLRKQFKIKSTPDIRTHLLSILPVKCCPDIKIVTTITYPNRTAGVDVLAFGSTPTFRQKFNVEETTSLPIN